MGAFRFVLAASVMLSHMAFFPNALPHPLTGAVAVEGFYIVSGFLITLVLCEKYKDSLYLFYSNRFLRIFPIYWACLALYIVANALVVYGFFPVWNQGGMDYKATSALLWAKQHGDQLSGMEIFSMVFVNIGIFGQDIIRGFGKTTPDLFYHQFVYARVAWTIGVELTFYLIAPFVVRRVWLVCLLLVASLIGQYIVSGDTLRNPFDREFFAYELCFFMAGSLGYRVYTWIKPRPDAWIGAYVIGSAIVVALLTIFYDKLPQARMIYLAAVSIGLPGIVILGRKNPFDGILGDLSYPIYLVHPLLMLLIFPGTTVFTEIAAIGVVFIICFGIIYFVERPIERIRQARVASAGRIG